MSRVTQAELDASVHQIRESNQKNPIVDSNSQFVKNRKRVYIDQDGNEYIDQKPDNVTIVAIATTKAMNCDYQILANDDLQLYEPYNATYISSSKKRSERVGIRNPFTFRNCDEYSFNQYISYLKTKSKEHLRIAQRGIY